MATILKCPRCQQGMDVTSVSPGATVRCPDCGQMARVPTGNTSVRAKSVSPPIPAPAAPPPSRPVPGAPSRERGTKIRARGETQQRQQPPPKKSSSGLFVGLGIGAVAVIGVIAYFTMKGSEHEAPTAVPVVNKPKDPVVFAPKLPPNPDKPIVLGKKEEPSDSKPTVVAKSGKSAETANWPQLMQMLRPAGGFDHDDRPEGVAFLEVKSFGKGAYPKLIGFIDDEDTAIGIAAVAVLNALTGRDTPLPKGVNKSRVKAEWEEWLKNPDAAPKTEAPKPDAPK